MTLRGTAPHLLQIVPVRNLGEGRNPDGKTIELTAVELVRWEM
ncbi:hypothetical protein PDIG_18640 [Penicillium digitatum PHI26]|jgi:hypothetical protein|uniref:Uncharacterized protein n=2 Tax=Penicillium digitatum TaxID=36651 RepID=K9GQM1_PEND2|nr:hypothetical protein PDIP_56470 [Penicillium digitatum Pd1]EKV11382.1 hypothetical protein PDIP_56470 [Penicillium digitatum Pd1]EKV16948.1 hypothetical protein PDIG_18640 [Penicillium digitatum PHI26]